MMSFPIWAVSSVEDSTKSYKWYRLKLPLNAALAAFMCPSFLFNMLAFEYLKELVFGAFGFPDFNSVYCYKANCDLEHVRFHPKALVGNEPQFSSSQQLNG